MIDDIARLRVVKCLPGRRISFRRSKWNQRTFCHFNKDTFVIFTVHFGCVQRWHSD